ncbi:hypothetical protein JMJ35_002125 [Cladonia borealis]|uniref:Uncharacterized protein n=1 Tax=Cladonia borealis TaxID=184061 RepID=A0AA39R8L9_9LECA|nr:hypothetical protein JMJ35_002125 [Cladonia borealis]
MKAPSAIAALQAAAAARPKRKLPIRGTSVAASPSNGKLPGATKDAPQSISSREDSSSLPESNSEKGDSEEGSSGDDDKIEGSKHGDSVSGDESDDSGEDD